MSIYEKNNWKFMIVHKGEDIPFIHMEFESLVPLTPENHFTLLTGPQGKTHQEYRWINDISYTDSEKEKHTIGVLECVESEPDPKEPGRTKTTRFRWITNFTLKDKQVIELANQGGRIRWKIENEGFNVQKNGGFDLEHAYTTDPVASRVFYFLLQIAHLLAQLIEKAGTLWVLFRQAFPDGVGKRTLGIVSNRQVEALHFLSRVPAQTSTGSRFSGHFSGLLCLPQSWNVRKV